MSDRIGALMDLDSESDEWSPPGLQALARRGIAHRVVPNDPALYREDEPVGEPILCGLTARELLDWDRGDR